MTPSATLLSSRGTVGTAAPGRQQYRIASIPADGIGPEVISAGITVLRKLVGELGSFDMEFQHFDWGSERYGREGRYMPDDALEVVKGFDAVLFGAVGAPGRFRSCCCCFRLISGFELFYFI